MKKIVLLFLIPAALDGMAYTPLQRIVCLLQKRPIKTIIGVGNRAHPGTHHNAGHLAVSYLAGKYGLTFQEYEHAAIALGVIGSQPVALIKTHQANETVEALEDLPEAVNPEETILIHDELDDDPQSINLQTGKSCSHKGARALNKEYDIRVNRIAWGIGRPNGSREQAAIQDWVLQSFRATPEEITHNLEEIDELLRQQFFE